MNVRKGPSTSTAKVTTVRHGSYVKVLGYEGEWARILTSGGSEGYVKIKYLMLGESPDQAPTATPVPEGGEVVYKTFGVRTTQETPMRTQPDDAGAVMGTLPEGAELTVYAYNDDWAYAAYGKYKGFVLKEYLKVIG